MSARKFSARETSWAVSPDGEALHSQLTTIIHIVDEGAGEYVEVAQSEKEGISIDPDEWPALRNAIDKAISNCLMKGDAR